MSSSSPPLKITVLGSGTSTGVPTLGCHCAVCRSEDPRDKRLRPSILIQYSGRNVLVDATPDFRYQALRAGIKRLDAILFTHGHADHILGLDDVRPLNAHQGGPIPIYGSPDTLAVIRRCFSYAFDGMKKESSSPELTVRELDGKPFDLFGITVTPVPVYHGSLPIYGYRLGDWAAYITDQSDIPPESLSLLSGLDVLFLDALRHKSHPTHSTVEKALQLAALIRPRRVFLTHICHDLSHAATEGALPPEVRLAYDTLEITSGGPAE